MTDFIPSQAAPEWRKVEGDFRQMTRGCVTLGDVRDVLDERAPVWFAAACAAAMQSGDSVYARQTGSAGKIRFWVNGCEPSEIPAAMAAREELRAALLAEQAADAVRRAAMDAAYAAKTLATLRQWAEEKAIAAGYTVCDWVGATAVCLNEAGDTANFTEFGRQS